MQKMFQGKSLTIAEVQLVAKIKIVNTNVNVMDVNVTARRQLKNMCSWIESHRKQKVLLIGKKKRLKKSMLKTIQHI
jgi:hypothetical protein